jgi:hypothetical protein
MVRYTGQCHCKTVTYQIDLGENELFQMRPEYDFCVDCRVSGSLLVFLFFNVTDPADRLDLYSGIPADMAHGARKFDSIPFLRECRKIVLFCMWMSITYKSVTRNRKLAADGNPDTIDIALGTLNEEILRQDPKIVPWRYAWLSNALEWMRRILPTEKEIKKLELT